MIDTHAHLDVEEFKDDLPDVIARAKAAGVSRILLPTVDLKSVETVANVCRTYPNYVYPMVGLHPEEVRKDYAEVLGEMKKHLISDPKPVAIGEVGLDYYWSREFEKEQIIAFEEQVNWSIETRLPLMVHCRKAQNDLVHILRKYENQLVGGVFHCFTGNEYEAAELLSFTNFVLGIGGVLTFKKSNLPEMLPAHVPLSRIVLETDSPYMAPVPHRGERNESAFVANVLQKLADSYGVTMGDAARITTDNAERVFRFIN